MITESPIAQSRAEELGFDLWENFVIPPYYDSLDLISARRPRIIIGGRGCGKTMLLRYLCHESQFSSKRTDINKDCIGHIGLYWKIDTQFAKMLNQRNIQDDVWQIAFEHMATLLLSIEVLKSIESIARSKYEDFDIKGVEQFEFSILNSFRDDVPQDFNNLKKFLKREYNYFQAWVNSPKNSLGPKFLPKGFLVELINEIKNQNEVFSDSNYFVYIDEYENSLVGQQKLINTWIKHSEMPLIFNIAMKRNSFNERNTIGNEQITNEHDFRIYDLESYYNGNIRFDVFAAEILFLRLWSNGHEYLPINPDKLRSHSISYLIYRRSPAYRIKILEFANKIFPSQSQEELAREVINDNILLIRLKDSISEILLTRKSKFIVNDFFDEKFPEAMIIIPALLHRDLQESEILEELNKIKKAEDNKFTGKTNWIHNNFIGCLLLLYGPLGRVCPFYAGFDAFCQMSNTNLRHFLELCNKSFTNEILSSNVLLPGIKNISIKHQAEAAKSASAAFLKEVKSCGTSGNLLHTFVIRLGTYFKYINKRPSQSEPEQNHFSINGEINDSAIGLFIHEAIKWSILYDCKITKRKGGDVNFEDESFEYILNPIYAPYFHISYRKKRRVDFSITEFTILSNGTLTEFEGLMNKTIRALKLDKQDSLPNLFTENN
jgi:hypothetical protein